MEDAGRYAGPQIGGSIKTDSLQRTDQPLRDGTSANQHLSNSYGAKAGSAKTSNIAAFPAFAIPPHRQVGRKAVIRCAGRGGQLPVTGLN